MPGAFLFKTIIGKELRKRFCGSRYDRCSVCAAVSDCVYGSVLEPVVVKENAVVEGKYRVTHPLIMETNPFAPHQTTELVLRFMFIGKAIQHMPIFYSALKTRENMPLFKAKATFVVKGAIDEGKSLSAEGVIDMGRENSVWEYAPDTVESSDKPALHTQKWLIKTQTPLRFRGSGRYTDEFTAKNFMNCLHKRMQTLVTQHGVNDFERPYTISPGIGIAERNYSWADLDHYSTRQRKVLKLGGNSGAFVIEGRFTEYERVLLRFAEIFHAGEQAVFGLGRLQVKKSDEGGSFETSVVSAAS
jgi:hypothetical protein